jgi:Transposase Tn5 dimerisation domain/Transposase DNA-binding
MNDTPQPWVVDELAGIDLGDARLDKRLPILLDRFSRKPSVSIPAACRGGAETEAAYRFFKNPRVSPQKILAPHYRATLGRIASQRVVLLAQDTTEIDLTRAEEVVGGPLDGDGRRGFYDHAMLAFTPGGTPLGVVSAEIWARDPEEFQKSRKQKKKENRAKSIEEKESFRWLEGYRRACGVAEASPQTKVICLSDSEGDIYECYAEARAEQAKVKAHFIVRACQDRRLREGEKKLFEEVAAGPVLHHLKVEVGKRPAKSGDDRKREQARRERVAEVTVQAATVELEGPERPGGRPAPVKVNGVLVREPNPPEGEPPLEWLLLTELAIGSTAEVLEVIEFYCVRWNIEIYFRVLKGGCGVEEVQLEADDRIEACLAVYMIVAWRTLFVTRMGRECPEMSCEAVFSEEEWKAVYVVVKGGLPRDVPSLGEVVKMVAGLGGYLGRKGDDPPGPKTMWIGLQRMTDFAIAWRAFAPDSDPLHGKRLV